MPTTTRSINMLAFRRRVGEILDRVYYRKDRVLVRRGRKNMAVLIPLEDFQTYIADADTELYTESALKDMFRRDEISDDLRAWARARPSRRR